MLLNPRYGNNAAIETKEIHQIQISVFEKINPLQTTVSHIIRRSKYLLKVIK